MQVLDIKHHTIINSYMANAELKISKEPNDYTN